MTETATETQMLREEKRKERVSSEQCKENGLRMKTKSKHHSVISEALCAEADLFLDVMSCLSVLMEVNSFRMVGLIDIASNRAWLSGYKAGA